MCVLQGFETPPALVATPRDGSDQDDALASWVNSLFNTNQVTNMCDVELCD
jgi:hypothetical protein